MDKSIFKEHEIRGNKDVDFSAKQLYTLANALAYYFLHVQSPRVKTIALGRDAHEDSAQVQQEFTAALTENGINVIFIGAAPAPVLTFSLHVLPVEAGIYITTCPEDSDSLRIRCFNKTELFDSEALSELNQLYLQPKKVIAPLTGTIKYLPLVERYTQWLARQFKHLKKSRILCRIECVGSAAALIIPQLVASLKLAECTFKLDYATGFNSVAAIDVHKTKPLVLSFSYNADQLFVRTGTGTEVAGNQLSALYVQDISLLHPGVVVSDVSSLSLLQQVVQPGVNVVCEQSSTPEKINYRVKTQHALFGSTSNGHFFFNDRYFGYDDGIYAALRLLDILQRTGKTLEELLYNLPTISAPREVSQNFWPSATTIPEQCLE
ncbi:hypothetical protein H0X48_02385 [Candidatus Dependentiae bacterium]|nr:hypothetical protein [Candidatus Dependentiae bacterium]